jgi:hypothetical protein
MLVYVFLIRNDNVIGNKVMYFGGKKLIFEWATKLIFQYIGFALYNVCQIIKILKKAISSVDSSLNGANVFLFHGYNFSVIDL